MKIIALEEHTVSREIGAATHAAILAAYPYYDTFLKPLPADAPSTADLFELGERRIKEMDAAGIDMEILSYTNATQWLSGPDALSIAKAANDALAQSVKAYPDRFRAFATLPLGDPTASAEELRRTVKELGFVGTLISGRPQTGNVFLDDSSYNPLWDALTELDLPVYIHPNYTTADACRSYYSGLGDQLDTILSTYGFGWHLEAGIQVIRMILRGVFEKYPTLKVILGHWGEIVPYYLPRLDQMFSPAVTGLPEKFSTYFKRNVWVTPGGIYDNDDLEYCVRKVGIDRLLFATDFPYVPLAGARPFLENAPLSEDEKRKFAYLNAEKLLHLE